MGRILSGVEGYRAENNGAVFVELKAHLSLGLVRSSRYSGNLRWTDVGVEGERTSVSAGGLNEWTPPTVREEL